MSSVEGLGNVGRGELDDDALLALGLVLALGLALCSCPLERLALSFLIPIPIPVQFNSIPSFFARSLAGRASLCVRVRVCVSCDLNPNGGVLLKKKREPRK